MSDQQEGHLHMGNEVNTTYNHNNPQYNIACEQLVVHSRLFYHQTVNNNNRDNPDRREQDSVADPDSSHSNTSHYIHTDDLQEAVDILEERHLPACLVEILADPFSEEVKTAMIKFHLHELHLDTPEQDALMTEILQKDVSGAAFPWCCRQMVKEWQSVADSTVFFAAPAEAHVPFLQHMLRDPEHGETMAVVMSLTMLGLGRFLHDPYRVQTQLEELGFRDSSNYRIEEYSDVLKEFILHKTESSFEGRVWYDAAGLALGRSFSLPILLKVCDAKFLVQHVRTKETATEFSVTIGPSPDDRQLLMQTMYEHMASGRLPELCQHPSLHCPQFLQEFDTFCRANKNHVQRLVSAVDTVHRKPLLYCMEVKSSDDADKVHVVVPSKQWYLVLRLLADRQVDERDEEGNTLLHVAADTGDLDVVKIAVKSGASLTARNNKGQNPPQLAANRKKRDKKKTWTSYDCINGLHKACRSGDQNTVKVLLCSSVSVNDMDMIGRTPLHVACETGETDIATLLISLDAGVSVKDNALAVMWAWRVVLDAGFLRVCPIQPHFLRRICLAAGSCPARSHSSSFRIFSGHRMLKMRLRQAKAQEAYTAADREVKRSTRKDKRDYIDNLANQAEEAAGQGNLKDLYQVTKKLAGKFQQTDKPTKKYLS
nr:hypothetical protein BaRGS_004301 [Batillaria attramentaria]